MNLKPRINNLWLSDDCARRQGTGGASCETCPGENETPVSVQICQCRCHSSAAAVLINRNFLSRAGRALRRAFSGV